MPTSPITLTREEELEIIKEIGAGITITYAIKSRGICDYDFWEYRKKYPLFDDEVKSARACGASSLFDTMPVIADSYADPQRARVKIEGIQRYARMVDPKVYGDKVDINVNQTIDFTHILNAANSRIQALLPQRDVSEITDELDELSTDDISVTRVEDLF